MRYLILCASLLATTIVHAQDTLQEARYPLDKGATAVLGPDVQVTLESINDSRCPPNVMCVRKGNIDYHFILRAHGRAESFTLNTDTPRYTPAAVSGVSLVLDAGPPPSPTRDEGPLPTQTIHLQVVRQQQ
ncbi:MAG TPA: hypothetical protein VFF16_19455 [Telluria sp.]|nr:hypothetical protein [Telluria sp.]